MKLIAVPAFQDNYFWLLMGAHKALVVDPGDAPPVQAALARLGLALDSILVTHHHADHTGGVAALREAHGCAVFGPAGETLPEPITRVADGQRVQALGLSFEVIATSGHTAGHISYFCADAPGGPLLFCGDTLFSAGCGRLFEGTPAQMLASLARLTALPPATRVCCAHEYTLSNLRFAQAVEPGNADLAQHLAHCQALRTQGEPTLPSTLALERRINPFLRTQEPAVTRAAHQRAGTDALDPVGVFATLRQWKNEFR